MRLRLVVLVLESLLVAGVLLGSDPTTAHAECVENPKSLRLVRVPAVAGQLWTSDPTETALAPVPGATIELQAPVPGDVLRVTTNEEGYFSLDGVQPGKYRLRWSMEGLQSGEVDVEVGRNLRARTIAILVVDQWNQADCGFVCSVVVPSTTPLSRAPSCFFAK